MIRDTYQRLRRVGSDYRTAIVRESHGRVARFVPTFGKVLLARLRFNVGPRYYSLFELGKVPPASWDDFVTDDPPFKRLLLSLSSSAARDIANDKALFYDHCIANGLPTIPIIALVGNPPAKRYESVPRVTTVHEWRGAIARMPGDLFVKAVDGSFGKGSFQVVRNGEHVRFDGRVASLDDLYEALQARLAERCAWLVQPHVLSHDTIALALCPRALGTIRLVTCMRDGEPRLLLALMKITVGDNVTDNFHHGVSGNLVAPVDVETGTLASARGSLRSDWPTMGEITHHPETGQRIEGFVLPYWDDVVKLTLRAQATLPSLYTTGWDIAVTNDGPLVVEANITYSVDIMQVAFRCGLKSYLLRELGLLSQSSSDARSAATK